jgi:hypothetical protein
MRSTARRIDYTELIRLEIQCRDRLLEMIDECIEALRAGNHRKARKLFTRMDEIRQRWRELQREISA